LGRTVEKYSKTKRKERNHKRAAHHQPAVEIGGMLKNTLKTKRKERNHKEQHITQSLLS
jgi:hypothetical protein